MKWLYGIVLVSIIFIILSFIFYIPPMYCPPPGQLNEHYFVHNEKEVTALFPKTVVEIGRCAQQAQECASRHIQAIIAIPDKSRTFVNTARALDTALFNFTVPYNVISVVALTAPDDNVRNAANEAQVVLSQFSIDTFGQNIVLYKAFKAYYDGNARKEKLSEKEHYFLTETMADFKRSGLDLPDASRAQVKEILKQLSVFAVKFQDNINTGNRSIEVTREQLAGLTDDFINALEKKGEHYILTTDYPIYNEVLRHCTVEKTRKDFYKAFNNRAYPENLEVLNTIITLRDQLAKLLGYESFAALNIDNQMAKAPAHVRSFLQNLIAKAKVKGEKEFDQLITDLPEGVQLINHQVQPWDISFARTYYKKKYYNIDDREIAQYFSMERTLQELLHIYEQFFSIKLESEPLSGLWDENLQLIRVYNKQQEIMGYLILDLYPRKNKYNHACNVTMVPALERCNFAVPCIGIVIANFTKPTAERPSLLKLNEVRTFFHEFGHALHAIIGATDLASFSGTNVKNDFVEMPSQMLEEWLWDKTILLDMSEHYKTHEKMPAAMLDSLLFLKNFSSGAEVLGQLIYSFMSLDYFASGEHKDVFAIMKKLDNDLAPHLIHDPDNHMPVAFGHLTDYGARYYGYLWSRVFALDLFYYIKKQGLLNPEIGQEYATKILQPGGSEDPNVMLKSFLGREPNEKAFFEDMGL